MCIQGDYLLIHYLQTGTKDCSIIRRCACLFDDSYISHAPQKKNGGEIMTQDTTVRGKDNGKLTSRRRNLHRIKSNVHDFSRSGVYGLGRTIK